MKSPVRTDSYFELPTDQETRAIPAEDCMEMVEVRRQIDRIDRELIGLLCERLTYIERAGIVKPDRNTVRDEARIEDVVSKVLTEAGRQGFPLEIAEPVWRTLIDRCIAHEIDIYDEKSPQSAPSLIEETG